MLFGCVTGRNVGGILLAGQSMTESQHGILVSCLDEWYPILSIYEGPRGLLDPQAAVVQDCTKLSVAGVDPNIPDALPHELCKTGRADFR